MLCSQRVCCATLDCKSDPNVLETAPGRRQADPGGRLTAGLASPNLGQLSSQLPSTLRPSPRSALDRRTHCSPSSTWAEVPQPPLTLNEPRGEAREIKRSGRAPGSVFACPDGPAPPGPFRSSKAQLCGALFGSPSPRSSVALLSKRSLWQSVRGEEARRSVCVVPPLSISPGSHPTCNLNPRCPATSQTLGDSGWHRE